MAEVTIRTEFQTSVETVWNVVTDNERYGWRSDLEKIELSEEICLQKSPAAALKQTSPLRKRSLLSGMPLT